MGFTKEFNKLVTEERNSRTMDLDLLDTAALVERIQSEDFEISNGVKKAIPDIARAVDIIADKLKAGGRLIYFGAGTSGRLGVLDATECSPTFGIEAVQIQAHIAGGREAMFRSFEDTEDSKEMGTHDAAASTTDATRCHSRHLSERAHPICRWRRSGSKKMRRGHHRHSKQFRQSSFGMLRRPDYSHSRTGSTDWLNQNEGGHGPEDDTESSHDVHHGQAGQGLRKSDGGLKTHQHEAARKSSIHHLHCCGSPAPPGRRSARSFPRSRQDGHSHAQA